MAFLADTNVAIWWMQDNSRLGAAARDLLTSGVVFLSAAAVWEVTIKTQIGKLALDDDFVAAADDSGFVPLPITHRHAAGVGELPLHHADPFDRLMIAQARAEQLTLVTGDERLAVYDVNIELV